jgi:diphthine synthase
MVLFFVGLGLATEKDITLKGLEAVKSSDKIYLEMYTAILGVDTEKLKELF